MSEPLNKDIEIKDLPPEETLTPEEKERLAGAGRKPYLPTFETLEAREMMDAGIGGSAPPVSPPSDTAHVRQVVFQQQQKVIVNPIQLSSGDLKQQLDKAIQPADKVTVERKEAIGREAPGTGLKNADASEVMKELGKQLGGASGKAGKHIVSTFDMSSGKGGPSAGPILDLPADQRQESSPSQDLPWYNGGSRGSANEGFPSGSAHTFTATGSRAHFRVSGPGAANVIIEVRDASGREVGKSQHDITTGKNELNLSGLNAGTQYTARIIPVNTQPAGQFLVEYSYAGRS